MVKISCTPISGQVILTQKTHFRRISWPNLIHYQDYPKTLESAKEKLKKWYSIWKIGAKHHFSYCVILTNNDHSDFAFSLFWCTKKNCFVIRINKMTYSKPKHGVFYLFQYFLQHFSHSMFSPVICIGLRTNGVWMKLHKWFKQWNND